ncbi:MAG TPA: response regulator transcription factor [Candidatus Polarisedimenticolia bacterium]|nr:response regulator transcription factor [Candidatus Polarisedimenticolia bacterium]
MSKRILLVEDRPEIADLLQNRLSEEGFAVTIIDNGPEAVPSVAATRPEVVLLERALPEVDALEVCRRLRADRRTAHLPVMILSEEVPERDKVQGFEVGATDFITRPFGLDEFTARVKALIRRGGPRRSGVLRAGEIELDLDRQLATVGGRRALLTPLEMALLRELMSLSGRTLRRHYLRERIWSARGARSIRLRTIDAHVARLRKHLGPEGWRIVSVHGAGYRFESAPEAIPVGFSIADGPAS